MEKMILSILTISKLHTFEGLKPFRLMVYKYDANKLSDIDFNLCVAKTLEKYN